MASQYINNVIPIYAHKAADYHYIAMYKNKAHIVTLYIKTMMK